MNDLVKKVIARDFEKRHGRAPTPEEWQTIESSGAGDLIDNGGYATAWEGAKDWVGGAFDTLQGQNDFRATPYQGAVEKAANYAEPLNQFSERQVGLGHNLYDVLYGAGQGLDAAGQQYGALINQAARNYQGDLYGIGDSAYAGAQHYGDALENIGQNALATADRYASGLEGRAQGLESTGDYWGTALQDASTDMMNDPSAAAMAGRAAMDRAAAEGTARAASARGGNANLQIREAQGITGANNRLLANEIAAAAASELANRRALQANMLGQAGQTALQGRTAGAGVYNQAGATAAQGRDAAAGAFNAAADVVGQGREQQGNLYQAGANVGMAGEQARGEFGMRGKEGAVNTTAQAAGLLSGAYEDAAGTLGTGANVGMQGVAIEAGSQDAAQAANAGVSNANAANASDFWKGVIETAGKAASGGYGKK